MKKLRLVLVLVCSLAFVACNQDKIDQLAEENAQLKANSQIQDSLLSDYLNTFNQIQENLALIKEREQIISVGSNDPEISRTSKDMIIEDVQYINELMAQNKSMIEDLNKKLKSSNFRVAKFQRMVNQLKGQMVVKDSTIAGMKDELAAMNYTVEDLSGRITTLSARTDSLIAENNAQFARIELQTEQLSQQDSQLNKAYFVTGTFKELADRNILTKEGGFAGIGRSKKLKNSFDKSAFTEIDIREIDVIPVGTKKAEILTVHPEESFVIKGGKKSVESLEIVNPEKFWENSRYLVVVVD